MFYLAISLHGICYDFFFVAGYIYMDERVPPQDRASAQGLLTLVTSGFGSFIGSWISGLIVQMCMAEGEASILAQWSVIWSIPALAAGATALFYALSSRGRELSH